MPTAPSIGGAERYTQGLAEGLADLGHEVHVVVADVDDPEAFYELGHETVGPAEERSAGSRSTVFPTWNFAYRQMGRILGGERAIGSSTRRIPRPLRRLGIPRARSRRGGHPSHLFPECRGDNSAEGRRSVETRLRAHASRRRSVLVDRAGSAAVSSRTMCIALTEHETRQAPRVIWGARETTTAVDPSGSRTGGGDALCRSRSGGALRRTTHRVQASRRSLRGDADRLGEVPRCGPPAWRGRAPEWVRTQRSGWPPTPGDDHQLAHASPRRTGCWAGPGLWSARH